MWVRLRTACVLGLQPARAGALTILHIAGCSRLGGEHRREGLGHVNSQKQQGFFGHVVYYGKFPPHVGSPQSLGDCRRPNRSRRAKSFSLWWTTTAPVGQSNNTSRALKTGCKLEKRQLESYQALSNALAIFVPIAWKILLAPASSFNCSRCAECAGQRHVDHHSTTAPRHTARPRPTTAQATYAVAKLGGHLKRNGLPGWQTLGRGFERLFWMQARWLVATQRERSDHHEAGARQAPSAGSRGRGGMGRHRRGGVGTAASGRRAKDARRRTARNRTRCVTHCGPPRRPSLCVVVLQRARAGAESRWSVRFN